MHVRSANKQKCKRKINMGLNFGTKIAKIQKTVTPKCTDADLVESIASVAAAAEALYEAQADGTEICTVLDNLELVSQALAHGGITKQVLDAFNSEGELAEAAGVESLDAAALEAMGEAEVKKLTSSVTAGLEGRFAEYWAKFVAWLKNMWTKIVDWFKSLLTNQARYVNTLKDVDKVLKSSSKQFNPGASAAVHSAGDIEGALVAATGLIGDIEEAAANFKTSGSITKTASQAEGGDVIHKVANVVAKLAGSNALKNSEIIKKFNEAKVESKPIKDLGFGSAGDLSGVISKYITLAESNKWATATKNYTDGLSVFIKEAEAAAKLEGEAAASAKEASNSKREAVTEMLKYIRELAKTVQKCGGDLVKVAKVAGSKAATEK